MSRSRWILSLLVVSHATAVALGSIPTPPPDQKSRPSPGVLDRLAGAVARAHAAARLERVKSATRAYLDLVGLPQEWSMFAPPPEEGEYVRVRYFVRGRNGATWTATELVMPAHREDRVRLWQSFRD